MDRDQKRERLQKRVWEHEWPDSEPVFAAGQVGVSEGVYIDFRHPDFPEGDWEARHWWNTWTARDNEVRLVFPHEARINLDSLARQFTELEGRTRTFLREGDCIKIESVEQKTIGGGFDHPQDTVCQLARIVVVRDDGDVLRPRLPLTFFGATQLKDAPANEAYDRLIERIMFDHGQPGRGESMGGFVNPSRYHQSEIVDLGKRAQLAAVAAEGAVERLKEKLDESDLKLIGKFASATALAAFFQAKHELRDAESAAASLKTGGKARTARAKDNRFKYASETLSLEPNLSLNALAVKVIDQVVELDGTEPMSTPAMYQSLKAGIERGDVLVPASSSLKQRTSL